MRICSANHQFPHPAFPFSTPHTLVEASYQQTALRHVQYSSYWMNCIAYSLLPRIRITN